MHRNTPAFTAAKIRVRNARGACSCSAFQYGSHSGRFRVATSLSWRRVARMDRASVARWSAVVPRTASAAITSRKMRNTTEGTSSRRVPPGARTSGQIRDAPGAWGAAARQDLEASDELCKKETQSPQAARRKNEGHRDVEAQQVR